VQVDTLKPTLKAPKSKHLKLEHEKMLSNCAFKVNLRRYITPATSGMFVWIDLGGALQVDPIKPKLKLPGTKRFKVTCDMLLSTSAFKFNLRRYTWGGGSRNRLGRRRQGPDALRVLRHTPR